MANLTLDATDPIVLPFGEILPSYIGGANMLCAGGHNSGWDLAGTGTALSMQGRTHGAIQFRASIDGGAFANLTMPTVDTTGAIQVFTGLSDSLHQVKIRHSSGAKGNLHIPLTGTFTLTGANPSFQKAQNLTFVYPVMKGIGRKYIEVTGCMNYAVSTNSNGFDNYTFALGVGGKIRFYAKTNAVSIAAFRTGQSFKLFVDGVPDASGKITLLNTSDFEYFTPSTSLDDNAYHLYEIEMVAGNLTSSIGIIQIGLGGSGLLRQSPLSALGRMGVIGDSISITGGAAATDSSVCHPAKLARLLNYGVWSTAVAGDVAMNTDAATITQATKLGNWAARMPFHVGLILLGHNDAVANIPAANFKVGFKSIIDNFRYICDRTYVLGNLNTNQTTAAGLRDAYLAVQSAAVSELNDPTVTFHDTTGWIDPTTDTVEGAVAGTHPTDAGYDKIVTRLLPIVRRYPGRTVSGAQSIGLGI